MCKSRFVRGLAGATLPVLLLTSPADGQETTRVSVDSSGAEGNGGSGAPAISGNGQIVAFGSGSSNFVVGDFNSQADIFVHDRATGITERVNLDSSGTLEANDWSGGPSISADGQVVAFVSVATNLVPGDKNGASDIFVHDRATGVTERVSVDSSGAEGLYDSIDAAISADGSVVAFMSRSTNLVSGDTNGTNDVFVHDRKTGITERVSVNSSGAEGNWESFGPAISADGRFVAFHSRSKFVPNDYNASDDIFVHDRTTGITERVSVDSSGAQSNGSSSDAAISADGRFVAFTSFASNLVAGDTNGMDDIFVHDRATGITERVSVDSTGADGDGVSRESSISADGNVVVFWSLASNLVARDTNGVEDVFAHDRSTGSTVRVSVRGNGVQGDSFSYDAAISADGQTAAFTSHAKNLVDGDKNRLPDAFVRDFCMTIASWSNYGMGFPGTNGVPAFTARSNPVLGKTITLDLGNSYGNPTSGLMLVGFQQASRLTNLGGFLLLVPASVIPITLFPGGDSFSNAIPDDRDLCGVTLDLQALEVDPGAAKGVSFTRGLELLIGD